MDMETLETNVYVHSPLTEYSMDGGYYTSYAIHLMSNNPCFNQPHSHVRRRYSEFVKLRELLIYHHPTLTPPVLPSKSYFNRFNDDFIEQRMKGLQKFLKEVLSTPVYLSDKGLHLFLQSNCSMSEINEKCLGDVPAPQLIEPEVFTSHQESANRSINDPEPPHFLKSLHHMVLDDCKIGMQSQRTIAKTPGISMPTDIRPSIISSLSRRAITKSILISQRNGSLNSSASSSPSSSPSNTSCISCSERSKDRRVSFSERVKVAVVTHYGISVLRP